MVSGRGRWRIVPTLLLSLLLLATGFAAGAYATRLSSDIRAASEEPPEISDTFGVFWQAWHLVQDHYVDRQALDPARLTYGAVQGMLAALGDDGHTRFLSPADVQSERAELSGKLDGIGIQVASRNGHVVIVAPIPGSPAQQAGLKAGDTIVSVDGQEVSEGSLTQAGNLIRGPAGTSVTLSVVHQGDAAPVDITVTRATITVPSISWATLPGTSVAQILVAQFPDHTTDQLVDAIAGARAAGATALILDLRNDPGGIRDEAIGVASQFLDSGDVLVEQDADGARTEYQVKSGGTATTMPLEVLINEGSASSAEIVAGAIQDHQRATLVGSTTFGTGTVLSMYNLSDGSAIFLGTAEWLTPNGRQIWHHGIAPDVAVAEPAGADPLTPDQVRSLSPSELQASSDAQLLAALHQLTQGAVATVSP
jgi:carboxyl-terminal processing protease